MYETLPRTNIKLSVINEVRLNFAKPTYRDLWYTHEKRLFFHRFEMFLFGCFSREERKARTVLATLAIVY